MEAVTVILLLAALAGVALAFFVYLPGRLDAQRRDVTQAIQNTQQAVQQHIDGLDLKVNQRLDGVHRTVGESLSKTTETVGKIGEQLGSLRQSADRILEVGKDMSRLQEILQPPALRGGFGELLLERLLAQVVPHNYTPQYRFKNGEAVDAVVRLGAGMVPVDSKFPLESFRRLADCPSEEERRRLRRECERAARSHIDAVAMYIRPDEGTFDFALMYIPAESVYYEINVAQPGQDHGTSLITYAQEKRVFPVSPSVLYPYLLSVALGLKGLQVEERAREILDHLARLNQEFGRFRGEFVVLGGHIGRAKNKYDDLDKAVGHFGDRLALPLGEGGLSHLAPGGAVPEEPAVLSPLRLLPEESRAHGSGEGL